MSIETISNISRCINTLTMNLLIFLFFKHIYRTKYAGKMLYAGIFAASVIIMILVNQLQNPVINFIYTFVSVNAICVIFFNAELKKALPYNTLFLLIMLFCDAVTISIWSVLGFEDIEKVLNQYEMMFISNLLNIMVMYVFYRICVFVLSKRKAISVRIKEIVFLLFMTIFEIFVFYNFLILEAGGIVYIATLTGFLVFNIYATYMINQISSYYKYKYQSSLFRQQNEMQLAHYQELNRKYTESNKLIHDIRKHLDILDQLKSYDEDKSDEYTSLVKQDVAKLSYRFQCTNQILSIVMGQKILLAKSLDIKTNTEIEDIPLDFMNDLDITAIFANLWDNAIEACKKVKDGSRFINMTMDQMNSFIVINMENSFDSEIVLKKGIIASTKKNHEGVGLKIIKSTVKKYNGVFITKHEEKIFSSEITMPVPLKSE